MSGNQLEAGDVEDASDSAMGDAVRDSLLPVLLLHVADATIVEVSAPVALLLGAARSQLLGHELSEFIDRPVEAGSALQRVNAGELDGYRHSRRTYHRLDGTDLSAHVWLSAYTDPPRRSAIAIVLPDDLSLLDPLTSEVAQEGDPLLAMGTADADWRLDRISADVEQILGYTPESVLGATVLSAVHPADVPRLLATVAHDTDGCGASLRLRLRRADGSWRLCRTVISSPSGTQPPPLGFTIAPVIRPGETVAEDRPLDLQSQLRFIAREFVAAGVTAELSRMPDAHAVPALARLSARELEIATRLLAGDRVPLVARSLFLSESTVRNHLTSVYRKLGISSQQELLNLLRP
ncbi:MAG: hypothetical protein QOK42_2724 [Frankiaceae bacterium]|jgi:PAS domain S-box-containing protein|nr:hypothetical protein [Frankiaceae bacterium]MDX6226161.1 hypothetical protein [Frankiales bacterium]MDX6273639.1 hypothetical protein [Frankiales bacterium]